MISVVDTDTIFILPWTKSYIYKVRAVWCILAMNSVRSKIQR